MVGDPEERVSSEGERSHDRGKAVPKALSAVDLENYR